MVSELHGNCIHCHKDRFRSLAGFGSLPPTKACGGSRYENLLLLDLPPPGELLEIEQWYQLQTQHRIQAHQQLEQRWSEEVSAVVAAEKINPECDPAPQPASTY